MNGGRNEEKGKKGRLIGESMLGNKRRCSWANGRMGIGTGNRNRETVTGINVRSQSMQTRLFIIVVQKILMPAESMA